MRGRVILCLVVFSALLSVSCFADAVWKPVPKKFSYDFSSSGFCVLPSQCLVDSSFNELWDGRADRFWLSASSDRPKCLDDGQFVLDYYCDDGLWRSRSKFVAEQLVALSGSSPSALFCSDYKDVLNRFSYLLDDNLVSEFLGSYCVMPNDRVGDCVNNVCVLNYSGGVAFGFALNVDIASAKSPLIALNKSRDFCNSASGVGFSSCGDGIWFDDELSLLLYANVSSLPLPSTALDSEFDEIKNWVFADVHSSSSALRNYDFLNESLLFNYVYFAKSVGRSVFSVAQREPSGSVFFGGWHYKNVSVPSDACSRPSLFGSSSSSDSCKLSSNSLLLVSQRSADSGRVGSWGEIGSLRLQ